MIERVSDWWVDCRLVIMRRNGRCEEARGAVARGQVPFLGTARGVLVMQQDMSVK